MGFYIFKLKRCNLLATSFKNVKVYIIKFKKNTNRVIIVSRLKPNI